MKVAVLPARRAQFLTTYLYLIRLSAMATSVSNFMSISHWPAVATSWWWHSTIIPICCITSAISERRSCSVSVGGTGK